MKNVERKLPSGEMETLKSMTLKMENTLGQVEEIEVLVRPMANRWQFQKKLSKAKANAFKIDQHDEFVLGIEIAKEFFEDCLVYPTFTRQNGNGWTLEQQIEEYFVNSPETFTEIISFLLMAHSKKEKN